MSIFITGDIHGDHSIQKLGRNFKSKYRPTENDYLIIAGDFGLVWGQEQTKEEKYWLKWLKEKSFTTLFVDGNHENFDKLYEYPVIEWNGGLVHKIDEKVYHLMRGQYFNIDGTTIFTFGGARSHDIDDGIFEIGDPKIKELMNEKGWSARFRINKLSWWEQEVPNAKEMAIGLQNLEKHDNKVDFIITHEAAPSQRIRMGYPGIEDEQGPDKEFLKYLVNLDWNIDYKHWYFGHYHRDVYLTNKHTALYHDIVQIA